MVLGNKDFCFEEWCTHYKYISVLREMEMFLIFLLPPPPFFFCSSMCIADSKSPERGNKQVQQEPKAPARVKRSASARQRLRLARSLMKLSPQIPRTRLLRSFGILSRRKGKRARRLALLAKLLRLNRCKPRVRAMITELFIDHPGSEDMLIGFLAAHRQRNY